MGSGDPKAPLEFHATGPASYPMLDPSKPLSNARHEAFAVSRAAGASISEAYRKSGYAPDSANSNAPRLMANDGIKGRIIWLQTQTATTATLTTTEKREWIARLVRCRLALLPDDSDLIVEIAPTEHGKRRKVHDKLRGIQVDNDLAGDGSEAMANAALGTVVEAMTRIRSGRWRK